MKIKELSKEESGSTVVEASIVVPIVLMIIFVMMYLGFIMYQETALTVVANEAAASIGQIYSINSKDPFIGFTTPTELSDTYYYRSLRNALNSLTQVHGALDSEAAKKADWYSKYRIVSSRLYKQTGALKVSTSFESTPGLMFQKTAVVTIEAVYDLPFIKFFGITDSTVAVKAVGKAQCFDILDYASEMSLTSSILSDTLDEIAGGVKEVFNAIETFAGYILG